MTDSRPRIERLAQIIAEQAKAIADVELVTPTLTALSLSEFAPLVTSLHVWLNEEWDRDVRFLTSNVQTSEGQARSVRVFRSELKDLRTVQQHSADGRVRQSARRWMRSAIGVDAPSDRDEETLACHELIRQCEVAMEALVGLVKVVAKETRIAGLWAETTAAERSRTDMDIVQSVLADLGLSPRPGRVGFIERQASGAWSLRREQVRSRDDWDLERRRTIERAVVGNVLELLPCPYEEILDAVGVEPGTPNAKAVLVIAHGAVEVFDYEDCDDFLDSFSTLFGELFDRSR